MAMAAVKSASGAGAVYIADYFDTSISVQNHAIGGRNGSTFITEALG